ncbi:MAG: hypothetical protein HY597_05400 [Candidatus Omnitrophica bacterium]|nr:hypothetical protein [Candidatus Omnitrophota bacterium]
MAVSHKVFNIVVVILIFGGVALYSASQKTTPTTNQSTDEHWQLLTTGTLAVAHVERRLYEKEGSNHFFIRVRLTNVIQQSIGVDLAHYWQVIYPNQWGIHQEDHRTMIDEKHMVDEPLDNQQKEQLITEYHARKLTMVKPGQAVDYYREFNASGRADVDRGHGNYFILSLDGRVLVTDGSRVEALDCTWGPRHSGCGDLVIPFPVRWQGVPPDGRIITERLD